MRTSRDHPRSRGVYGPLFGVAVLGWGSSPLARGLRIHDTSYLQRLGIIPARAGFTHEAIDLSGRPEDYPRSRGVYLASEQPADEASGSSPLARGLPDYRPPSQPSGGIIPARAGFTRRCA